MDKRTPSQDGFFIGTLEDREIPYFSKIASLALETVAVEFERPAVFGHGPNH